MFPQNVYGAYRENIPQGSSGNPNALELKGIFKSDADAIANGLVVGDAYELKKGNIYHMPWGMVKIVRES